jgi:hypothetical protein
MDATGCFAAAWLARGNRRRRAVLALSVLLPCWWLAVPAGALAQGIAPPAASSGFGRPALISSAELSGFATLPRDRQRLIEEALAVGRDAPWLPYTPGSADPARGGFDCSGAMYFVLRRAGLDPPRTAAGQLAWLVAHHRLHAVPPAVLAIDDPSLKGLQPGDLLFWGRPAPAGEATAIAVVTHVAMYLGTEEDGRPVMINSTDGRSYRGTRANGYGVYDFRLPRAEAPVRFIGYGPPPGIDAGLRVPE